MFTSQLTRYLPCNDANPPSHTHLPAMRRSWTPPPLAASGITQICPTLLHIRAAMLHYTTSHAPRPLHSHTSLAIHPSPVHKCVHLSHSFYPPSPPPLFHKRAFPLMPLLPADTLLLPPTLRPLKVAWLGSLAHDARAMAIRPVDAAAEWVGAAVAEVVLQVRLLMLALHALWCGLTGTPAQGEASQSSNAISHGAPAMAISAGGGAAAAGAPACELATAAAASWWQAPGSRVQVRMLYGCVCIWRG